MKEGERQSSKIKRSGTGRAKTTFSMKGETGFRAVISEQRQESPCSPSDVGIKAPEAEKAVGKEVKGLI